MALPAALFIRKYSYKRGIMLGLALYAVGAFLFMRAVVVSDAYAAGGNFTGGGAAVEGKCDPQRKTADTEAVYSLYYDNLLGRNCVDALPTGCITHIYA